MLRCKTDYKLSPYTGWTRLQWEEVYKILLQGVRKFASPGKAYIKFPGKASYNGELSDWIEGFARTLFMSGPFLYQRDNSIIDLDGEAFDIAAFYKQGLLNGTDSKCKEYWGEIIDNDQKIVESAAIALFLYFSKKHIWDRLSASEKRRIAGWMQQSIGKKVYPNNWMLFNVIINTVLKYLGEDYSREEIELHLFEMDNYYVGDGWYRDGVHDVYDYYVGWAIYFYYLLWIKIDGDSYPELQDSIIGRAAKFIESYRYLFSGDGGYPCYGRSMTYRCAAVSIFPIMEFLNIKVIPSGQARRICSGNLKYFLEHGMITSEKYMTLGFHHAYQPLIEPYSGPGSPYWAAKAFMAFLLPAAHPFWTDREEALEIEKSGYSMAVPSAGMLIQCDKDTGTVNLFNQKSSKHFPKKYGDFCYSSYFGFEPREIDDEFNYDNAISLFDGNSSRTQRHDIYHLLTVDNFSVSYHFPYKTAEGKEDKNTVIYSAIVLKDDFHLRFHHIKTNRKIKVFEGGMPIGFTSSDLKIISGDDWEYCRSETGSSFIRRLSGYDMNIPATGFKGNPAGNHVLFEKSVVPAMKREKEFNGEIVTGVLVFASLKEFTPEDALKLIKKVKVENTQIRLKFYDEEEVFFQIHHPQEVKITLNKKQLSGQICFARVDKSGRLIQMV
jgi:hypothetical protein